MSPRNLRLAIAASGIFSIAFATALASHIALGLAQSASLLGGDYGAHRHGGLAPVGLAAATAAAVALFLYAVHLTGAGQTSLPSLAREFHARIDWRTLALSAAAGVLILMGMETSEQLAAGRFDGFLSPFGSTPVVALGVIAFFSAIGTGILRLFCAWLAGAHARIVVALSFLLEARSAPPLLPSRRRRHGASDRLRYACEFSHVRGTRGPPAFAS